MLHKVSRSTFTWVIGIITVLIASIPLLNIRNIFALDWINHLYVIEYFGEYLKQNLSFPDVINTSQVVGIPMPLFYAQKAYSIGGALSAFLGSARAVRCMILVLLLLQFFHVVRISMAKIGYTIIVAVIVTWAIYPLTNLYTRSALTEFFAVGFLTCAILSYLNTLLRIERGMKAERYDIVAAGLFLTAAAVTHPITALYGTLLLGFLAGTAFLFVRRQYRRFLIVYTGVNTLLIGLVLSPWLYCVHLFKDQLPIVTGSAKAFLGWGFFPKSIDSIWSRLSPVPIDIRSVHHGIVDIPTPYLDAQVTLPLFVILIVLAFVHRDYFKLITKSGGHLDRALVWMSIFLAAFFLTISVHPSISTLFGGLFDILQFPYRLVTYVNLGLLVGVLVLLSSEAPLSSRDACLIIVALSVALTMSFSGVVLQLVQASSISKRVERGMSLPIKRPTGATPFGEEETSAKAWLPLSKESTLNLEQLPTTSEWHNAYSISMGFSSTTPGSFPIVYRAFSINTKDNFGTPTPLQIYLTEQSLVVTNVTPFPWTHIFVDGVSVSNNSLVASTLTNTSGIIVGTGLAVMLPPGKHVIETKFEVSLIYHFLDLISWTIVLLWIIIWTMLITKLFISSIWYPSPHAS
jgi:hypothetical protein